MFATIFTKWNNFENSCLLLERGSFLINGSALRGKNLLWESKFLPLSMAPIDYAKGVVFMKIFPFTIRNQMMLNAWFDQGPHRFE